MTQANGSRRSSPAAPASRLAPLRRAARRRPRGALPRQLPDRRAGNLAHLVRDAALHARRGTTSSSRCRPSARAAHRRDLQPRLRRLAAALPGAIPSTRCSPACSARATCCGWPSATGARFLQASTSEVYGDPEVHPQPETYRGNVNPHRAARLLRRGQARRRDPVLRLRPRSAAPRCASRASSTPTARACARTTAGWSPTSSCQALAGDGRSPSTATARQTRCFCYVDDLVEGLLRLMESDIDDPGRSTSAIRWNMMQDARPYPRHDRHR